jgi:hypothetical protein
MRWMAHVARVSEMWNAYKILIGKPEEKKPRGWTTRKLEDNTATDLKEIGCENVDWIQLAHDKV